MQAKYPMWGEKPYYTLNEYCKRSFGEKFYKIALDAGFTCPNRDGTLDTRGCIFCSAGGSGDFAVKRYNNASISQTTSDILNSSNSIDKQISKGLALFRTKKVGSRYIAYFQAYTNTYAPIPYLEKIYTEALEHPDIAGISIATRPDCISEECLTLLSALRISHPDKFIWIELGLQTIHEETAIFIRRGYSLNIFEDAMARLKNHQLPVIVHIILGLPGETDEMQYDTIHYLNKYKPFGIKLQLLHILKGTDLADFYLDPANGYEPLSKEHYLNLLIGCIMRLSPDIVLHRVTGDGPKDLLLAPTWSLNKRDVLNSLHKQMKERHAYQGSLYSSKMERNSHATGNFYFI